MEGLRVNTLFDSETSCAVGPARCPVPHPVEIRPPLPKLRE
ncbi:hypothetical protein HMPREF0578_0393 [Mobiluncus mulieris 28-1]|nr:hypothetical protein HMPREF0577_1542 [Mobiluncus mulieris ATCC 35243]EEZ91356.1 hypothetical protein HMPREF0578_0393 [Mobiluncus mulieris 28-1]